MSQRRILLADPDVTSARALTKALRARGYTVQYAPDGSKALELSVLRKPDVIIFDEHCRLIEARNFVQILTSNPRTEDIPVLITASTDAFEKTPLREGVLRKPFNVDEMLSRVDHLCRRADAAKELKGDAREIQGALTQLPLADLLQILAMNRRTGRLLLSHGTTRGEVQLNDGRPVNARTGEVEGDKALFRLMAFKEGAFSFSPGPAAQKVLIARTMEDALLEGMRQVDERLRLTAQLPPLGTVVSLSGDAVLPIDPHPVTAEVLALLAQPLRLSALLDRAQHPDLDVLSALVALNDKGALVAVEGSHASEGPLLEPSEVHALRGRLMRMRGGQQARTAKILVCGSGPVGGRWVLRALPGITLTAQEPAAIRSSFGTLASLEVSDVLSVDFIMVPTAEAARPLWRPFASQSLAALVLDDAEGTIELARFAATDLRLPVVIAARTASNQAITSPYIPKPLKGAPAGVVVIDSDLRTAVRTALLAAVAAPVESGEDRAQRKPANVSSSRRR